MNFSENIMAGINNPECQFFVGSFVGQFMTFRLLLALIVGYFVFKAADKLAIEPTIEWLKNKWRKKI